jgi:catechol 2,3-dioxygenase-like lactoylglutathione lyase family enzyme
MTPALQGVLETSLYVSDLERSREFYTRLFDFPILIQDDRFCALGVCGRQVLLLFRKEASVQPLTTRGGTIPPHGGDGQLHLAFAIGRDEFDAWERRLSTQEMQVESRVAWNRGGKSLYFRDPDGHLVELATPGVWAIY